MERQITDGKVAYQKIGRTEAASYQFPRPKSFFLIKGRDKFVGRLMHTCNIFPHLQCCMPSLWRWKKEWQNKSARINIPKDFREDIMEWNQALQKFDSRRTIPDTTPIDLNWVRDTSLLGIGVLIGKKTLGAV